MWFFYHFSMRFMFIASTQTYENRVYDYFMVWSSFWIVLLYFIWIFSMREDLFSFLVCDAFNVSNYPIKLQWHVVIQESHSKPVSSDGGGGGLEKKVVRLHKPCPILLCSGVQNSQFYV
jgi:hypothetical protein